MSGPAMRRGWFRSIAALLLAASVAGCAARTGPAPAAPASSLVHDLRSLDDLTALFDRDRDHPRLVLLLSPT